MSPNTPAPTILRSNPLAPEWMLPDFSRTDCASQWTYEGTFTVPANSELPNQVITISQDAPFLIQQVAFFQLGASENPGLYARFRQGQGKRMSQEYVNYLDLWGSLIPRQYMDPGSNFGVDLLNTSGSTIVVTVVLIGQKVGGTIQPDPRTAVLDQTYIPLWQRYSKAGPSEQDRSYHYYDEFPLVGGAPFSLNVLMDDDADFYWRSFGGELDEGMQLSMQWFDQVENSLTFGRILSNNYMDTHQGRPIYPETYCPYGAALNLRGTELSGVSGTLKINLQGVKRYRL